MSDGTMILSRTFKLSIDMTERMPDHRHHCMTLARLSIQEQAKLDGMRLEGDVVEAGEEYGRWMETGRTGQNGEPEWDLVPCDRDRADMRILHFEWTAVPAVL